MSNTINNDVQFGGVRESLFQKSANLNLHLDKFAITNQNNKIGKKTTNTKEYNIFKDNLKVLMRIENSVKITNSEVEKVSTKSRNIIKEKDIERQFNDITHIIEAKYRGAIGIEKTKDNRIKYLTKKPKKENPNSSYIFIDTLKNDLKSFNEEVHNLKRLLKQENQLGKNEDTLNSITFQRDLVKLLDMKKINTKHQKQEFYKKAYDTLISFQEQNFNFRINEKDLSKQTYNFVNHRIKDSSIKLTNGNDISVNEFKLFRALIFNSNTRNEDVIQSFKDDHIFNEKYMEEKVKEIVNNISSDLDFKKYSVDEILRKVRKDIEDETNLKTWDIKTITNRGVSKDLAKDFKHTLNKDSYDDFKSNHIKIVSNELTQKINDCLQSNDFEKAKELSEFNVSILNNEKEFVKQMKEYYKPIDRKIEIVFEKDNQIIDKFEVSKDEKIEVKNIVLEALKPKLEELKESIKETETLTINPISEAIKPIETIKVDNKKVIEDVKELKLIEENKSIAILNKLGALVDTTKTKDFTSDWQQKVEKIGLINYAKNLKIRLTKNHNFNKSMITKINDVDYIDFKKSTEKELDKLDINNDVESFEYKNIDNTIDTFDTSNLDRYDDNTQDITKKKK